MSYRKTYTTQTAKSSSPSQAIEDSKKKTSLLKDNSWIRKDDEEDEPVDRDPNFAKTILSRYRSNESLPRSEPEEAKSPTVRTSSSVHALTKRFSTSQDELNKSSTLPSSKTTTYTRSSSSTLKPEVPKTTTTSKTTVTEEPKTSTTTSTVTKDGKTTETTTITTTQSVSRSPVSKTPTKTETFTERVFSDVKSSSKGTPYTSYSPTKTTKVTETTVTSNKDAEAQLYDTLIPKSIKDDFPATDSKTSVSKTETVTVKSSSDGDGIKTTTTTRTSSTAEDDLYDTLLPKSMKSNLSSPVSTTSITKREVVTVDSGRGGDSPTVTSPTSTRTITSYSSYSSSDDTPSTRTSSYTISSKPSDEYTSSTSSYTRSYSRPDSSYEYTSVTSPTVYTTTSYKNNSRTDDLLADPLFSKSSIKTVYSSPERTVLEKDLCTYCRKPFNSDAKMVLEDMKINCHASCFKCEVCNSTLGHLKAGDSMWIYRRTVHCENCFDVTREKWRR
uniref:sciellin isoform X1 n=1 Tax=Centroberyx gerrardi TaxID=166262 RepID=UPI003AAE229E